MHLFSSGLQLAPTAEVQVVLEEPFEVKKGMCHCTGTWLCLTKLQQI